MTAVIILKGPPRTKKNSQVLVRSGSKMIPLPSRSYREYEIACLAQLRYAKTPAADPEGGPYNVRCLYYMPTRQRVDLTNLLEATDDILVKAGILPDDSSEYVGGHDGSRVMHDKANPRVEITITAMERFAHPVNEKPGVQADNQQQGRDAMR